MDFLTWLEGSALSTWLRESLTIWAFPTVLTLHTFAMAAVVGASTVLDLRLLGVARTIPLAPMRTLFRVIWTGFWLSLVSGALLFAAYATNKGTQWLFFVKLVLVAFGVATAMSIQRRFERASSNPAKIDGATKRLAVLSLAVWVATVTAGRLLAYIR